MPRVELYFYSFVLLYGMLKCEICATLAVEFLANWAIYVSAAIQVRSSRLDCLSLEDGTDRLFRNVRNYQPVLRKLY